MNILELCRWRYATKKMDRTQQVPREKLDLILEAARLAPSSSGLQPYEIIVVSDPELRNRIRSLAKEQSQISDCTYLLIFAAWDTYTPERIHRAFDQAVADRGGTTPQWDNYRRVLTGAYPERPQHENFQHAARQAYIGLAFAMLAAAQEQVDCTPMEGYYPALLDDMLGLGRRGLKSVALLPLGYRDASQDWLAGVVKSRRPMAQFVTELYAARKS